MKVVRRALACALVVGIVAPMAQPSHVVGAVPSATVARESRSYLVTTVGEFASVVRRDLGFWDTTVELTSHRFGGVFGTADLERLRNDPRVASLEVNGLVSNNATQTDGPDGFEYPNDRIPWGLDRLDNRALSLDGSYTYSNDGTDVTVYVVDSGVRASHVEFAGGRVQPGWDYRQNSTALGSYKSSVNYPTVANPPCGVESVTSGTFSEGRTDQHGHGTHVSGAVVGATTGVAKGATVIPVRALDCRGLGTFTMVEEALKWIVSNHTSGLAVVNLSLGVSPIPTSSDPNERDPVSPEIKTQILNLINEGVPVVIAAGNDAEDSCQTMPVRYEADYQGVIGVAASGWDDDETYFSNWGSCVDVYAPGDYILSAYKDSDTSYNELSGTSMAAPHVAGVIALMLEADPTLTPAQVDAAVSSNATRCAILPDVTRTPSSPNLLITAASSPATPAAPCVPRSLAATTPSAKSAVLTWTAPTSESDPSVTSYAVSTTPSSNGCTAAVGTTTCTVTGLSAGQTYVFAVKSVNSAGSSRGSKTASVRPSGTPDAPVLSAVTPGLTSIRATWAAALGDSNSYTVTAAPNGGTCTTTSTTCTVTGLAAGSSYTVTVKTTNVAGTSLSSSALTATTGVLPTAPSVSSSAAGLESVTLSWSATANTSLYRVKDSSGTVVCTTTETSCVVTGLVGGVAQAFTVESVNSFGASASQQVSATPDAQVGAVPGVTVRPGDKSLTVSWSAASGNDVTYTVLAVGASSRCSTAATTCTLTGLANGRAYNVYVVGANKSSQSSTATAVPGYAGFTVKATKAKRSRKIALTSFVVPVSTGTRKWSQKGTCRISGKYLVTPAKKATCTLTLRTAKNKTFAATAISLKISVT